MMFFFGAPSEGNKRRSGAQTRQKCLLDFLFNQKGHPLYLKMEVIPNVKG